MTVYWGNAADREMLRGRYRLLAAHGIDIFDRTAFLWGHSSSFRPGLAGWLARRQQPIQDWLRNRIRLSAYDLGRDDLRRYLDRIAAFRPVSLYGYPRAVALLAQEAEEIGFTCPSLRLAVLTGEPAYGPLVETIERGLRVPTAIEYGSVECGFLAGQWPDKTLRVREDNVLIETPPRADGRFDIVVTILTNPSFPLLRYEIGDVTDAPLTLPERGFAYLANVAGRDNDLVIARSGRRIHSARFDALFKYEVGGVRRFQLRQQSDGSLQLLTEWRAKPPVGEVQRVERKIGELVEGYPVQIEVVDCLPVTPAGKFRPVVSNLDTMNGRSGRL